MSNDRTDRQQNEDSLKVALDCAENIFASFREPLLVLNRDLRVKTANRWTRFSIAGPLHRRSVFGVAATTTDLDLSWRTTMADEPEIRHVDQKTSKQAQFVTNPSPTNRPRRYVRSTRFCPPI
jgi:hypothetical protein